MKLLDRLGSAILRVMQKAKHGQKWPQAYARWESRIEILEKWWPWSWRHRANPNVILTMYTNHGVCYYTLKPRLFNLGPPKRTTVLGIDQELHRPK